MRVLITGIAGFLGSHLAEYIVREKKAVIFGTVLPRESKENISHLKGKLKLIECDITNAEQLKSAVKKSRPDLVFHFAGQSSVSASWKIPQKTIEVNTIGSLNLLEAVKGFAPNARVLLSSSREVYGAVRKSQLPVKESLPSNPANPYAVSKLAMEHLALNYYRKYGVKAIIFRSFNITGPGRPAEFVCSDWARQLAEIELGLRKPVIETGNTNAVRDFVDVRDAIRAFWAGARKCKPGQAYNLCSGKGQKMSDVLKAIVSLSSQRVRTVRKPEKVVSIDVPVAIGSSAKLRKATGWRTRVSFHQTLGDLVGYWLEELSA